MASNLCFLKMVWILILVNFQTGIIGENVDIGVVYPRLSKAADSQPKVIIDLYKKYGIGKLLLSAPEPEVLEALRGSEIGVAISVPKLELQPLATSLNYTKTWYSKNIEPYIEDVRITYIILGREVIPGNSGRFVYFAMKNLQTVLDYNELGSTIRLTTTISTKALQFTVPPSAAIFTAEALNDGLAQIIDFLQHVASNVLMVNLYPYFEYATDPLNVRLDFAQFTANETVLIDETLNYTNLFDATLDAFFWALERAGGPGVDLAVSETGWPTAGIGNVSTPALASTYNTNLVKHVLKSPGTPKKPGPLHTDTFIFSMFDENTDPDKARQNFGIFKIGTLEPAYPLFNTTGNEDFIALQRLARKRNRTEWT